MKPIVLVTGDRRAGVGHRPGPRVRPRRDEALVIVPYLDAVARAGGIPLVVPPGDWDADALLDVGHALLITGGGHDIDPARYGEARRAPLGRIEPLRTDLELALARAALRRDLPVLGICGGMQVLAVASGGRLFQDLPTEFGEAGARHVQDTDPATTCHGVVVDGIARQWLPRELLVNSTHHQAVADPGRMVACGYANDGLTEVIASPDHRFVLGVQWHPELLLDDAPYRALTAAAQVLH